MSYQKISKGLSFFWWLFCPSNGSTANARFAILSNYNYSSGASWLFSLHCHVEMKPNVCNHHLTTSRNLCLPGAAKHTVVHSTYLARQASTSGCSPAFSPPLSVPPLCRTIFGTLMDGHLFGNQWVCWCWGISREFSSASGPAPGYHLLRVLSKVCLVEDWLCLRVASSSWIPLPSPGEKCIIVRWRRYGINNLPA